MITGTAVMTTAITMTEIAVTTAPGTTATATTAADIETPYFCVERKGEPILTFDLS